MDAPGDIQLVLNPSRLDFGGATVGESVDRDFLFQNIGNTPFRVTRMTIQNTAFKGVLPTGPFDLESGATAQGRMRFTPPSGGTFNGVLRVYVNNLAEPILTLDLLGEGLLPKLSVQIEELDFGAIRYGETKQRYFSLANLGRGRLNLKASFRATGALQYAIAQSSLPTIVPPLETAKVYLEVSPSPDGGPITELVLETNDPARKHAVVRLYHRVRFDFDVVAHQGDLLPDGSSISYLAREPSLNDNNDVAVVAVLNGTRHTVLSKEDGQLRDRLQVASDLNPAFGMHFDLRRNFYCGAAVQINNARQVTWRATSEDGLFSFIVRQDRSPATLRTVAQNTYRRIDFPDLNLDSPFDYAFPFNSKALYPWVTLNNLGRVLFSGVLKADVTKTVLATARDPDSSAHEAMSDFYRSGWFPGFPELYPMIADNGRTVVRAGGDATSPIVDFADPTLTNPVSSLIAGTPEFTALGSRPGISDDGRVVAFAADSADEGTGIFVAMDLERTKVLGLAGDGILDPGETWEDRNDNGVVDAGEDHGVLTHLVLDARVAVNRASPERDDRYHVAFLGYGQGSPNGDPPALGIYTVRVEWSSDGSLAIVGPTLLLQVGDRPTNLSDQVTNLATYDPLNARGGVAFWVGLESTGSAVLRTTDPLVVNSVGDEPDGDLSDGRADTGSRRGGYSGLCTLRAAMQNANLRSEPTQIVFGLPGDPPYVIKPRSPFPELLKPVQLLGTTQRGFSTEPVVFLNGSLAGDANGLKLTGGDSRVSGLRIESFAGNGIVLAGPGRNTIGGDAPDAGNTITGNGRNAIVVLAGEGNRICYNRIFRNAGLGIDLGDDGPDVNDAEDRDAGPNGHQNHPDLWTESSLNQHTLVHGALRGVPSATYRIDVYACEPDQRFGQMQGVEHVGLGFVTTSSSGLGPVEIDLGGTYAALTATATDDAGNTSEFGPMYRKLPLGRSVAAPAGLSYWRVYVPDRHGGTLRVTAPGAALTLSYPSSEDAVAAASSALDYVVLPDHHKWYLVTVDAAKPVTLGDTFLQTATAKAIPWNFYYFPAGSSGRVTLYEQGGACDKFDAYFHLSGGRAAQPWEATYHGPSQGQQTWYGHCWGASVASILFQEPPEQGPQNDLGTRFSQDELEGLLACHAHRYSARMVSWDAGDSGIRFTWPALSPVVGPDRSDYFVWRFHTVMQNYLLLQNKALVMDLRDYNGMDGGGSVWNHAVYKYEATIAEDRDAVGDEMVQKVLQVHVVMRFTANYDYTGGPPSPGPPGTAQNGFVREQTAEYRIVYADTGECNMSPPSPLAHDWYSMYRGHGSHDLSLYVPATMWEVTDNPRVTTFNPANPFRSPNPGLTLDRLKQLSLERRQP